MWLQAGAGSFLRRGFTEGAFVFVVYAVKTPTGQKHYIALIILKIIRLTY